VPARLRVGEKTSNADEIAAAITKASMKEVNRDRMRAIAKLDYATSLDALLGPAKQGKTRASVGDEIRQAGNALTKYIDGQKEIHGGALERRRIRRVFNKALAASRERRPGLTMSDLQALLWYPEKRLYDAAGAVDEDADEGYADDEAPDHANAAVKLAARNGIGKSKIDAVLREVDLTRNAGKRGSGRAQPRGRTQGAAPARKDGVAEERPGYVCKQTDLFGAKPERSDLELKQRDREQEA
jgi:hypothetical protein